MLRFKVNSFMESFIHSFIHSVNVYLGSPEEKPTKVGGDWVLVTALSLKMGSLSKSFIIPGLVFLFLYNEMCGLDY